MDVKVGNVIQLEVGPDRLFLIKKELEHPDFAKATITLPLPNCVVKGRVLGFNVADSTKLDIQITSVEYPS